jgi:hypothetical protein
VRPNRQRPRANKLLAGIKVIEDTADRWVLSRRKEPAEGRHRLRLAVFLINRSVLHSNHSAAKRSKDMRSQILLARRF